MSLYQLFPKGWSGTGYYSVCRKYFAMILLVVKKWVIIFAIEADTMIYIER